MKFSEYNDSIRNILIQLINDGYNKHQICKSTLGAQRGPQFESFLTEKNLGIKPLSRLIDSLDYELHLVPIPKGNNEKLQIVSDLSNNFEDDFKFNLIEVLEDVKKNKDIQKSKKETIFDDYVNSLIVGL